MVDPSTRARLNLAKLTVLAKSAGADGLTPLGFPGGAAASGDGSLWVFSETLGVALLGGALSVALKGDVPERLVVITDSRDDAAVMARRATYFASPAAIDVASVDGIALHFCEGSPVQSTEDPSQNAIEVPEGVDVVHEHGVTSFEVLGLEIGRIEDGKLAVGVGKHDREAHRMANPFQDPEEAMRALAERIRAERRSDVPGSAATSYARERWLRAIVVAKPDIIGLGELTPVAPPRPRQDLRAVSVAPAVRDGVVVAFSVGVDPDVIPSAADVRAMHAPDSELVIVVPEADALPNTHRVAAALRKPARIITVPNTWAALGD